MATRIASVLLTGLLVAGLLAVPLPAAAADDPPTIENAVAFTDTDEYFVSGQAHTLIEVRFDTAINNSTVHPANITVSLQADQTSPEAVYGGPTSNDRQLLLDLGPAQNVSAASAESVTVAKGDAIEDTNGTAFDGGVISPVAVETTTATITEGETNRTAWRGETVALVGDEAGETITVHSKHGHDLVKRVQIPDDGQVYAVTTEGLAFNQYEVRFDGRHSVAPANGDRLLVLANYTMELSVEKNPDKDDATVTDTENLTGTVSTNGVEENISVIVRDDDETIRSAQMLTNGSGEADFEFAPLADFPDEDWHFDLVAIHPATGVSAFYDVKVSEVDHDAGFGAENIAETRGNVVEIPVELSPTVFDRVAVDYATVVIGSDRVNYRAVLTVYDGNNDHQVEVQWNTYLAGKGNSQEFVAAETDADERADTVTVETITTGVAGGPQEILDSGLYELSVRSGQTAGVAPANATTGIILEDREPASLGMYTAPDEDYDDLDELRGTLAPAESVAAEQYAVVRADIPGLFGDLTNRTDLIDYFVTSDESKVSEDGVELTIEEATAQQNRERRRLTVSQVESVYTDEANDSVFLVVDTEAAEFMKAGTDYEAYWRIDEDHALIEAEAETAGVESEERRSEFAVLDQEATFDGLDTEGALTIAPTENQTISGQTTLAPGSELRVRVRSIADRAMRIKEVVVDENRSFAVSMNASGFTPGSKLTATVSASGDTISETVTGQVRVTSVQETTSPQSVEEPTTTETVTETSQSTPQPATVTEVTEAKSPTLSTTAVAPTVETTEATDQLTTPTQSPGFGIVIAIVAVFGGFVLRRNRFS